jgi:hypothetical protein
LISREVLISRKVLIFSEIKIPVYLDIDQDCMYEFDMRLGVQWYVTKAQ